MKSFTLASLAALASAAMGQAIQGFNYGSLNPDGSATTEQQYETMFNTAKNLAGTSGFTSARLFTTIQQGSTNSPTQAIQAAINTQTKLLLGLWGSGGQENLNNEIAALRAAVQQYGSAFTNLIVGISVGSEDLYRISPTGILNKSGVGANPDTIVNYINQVRSAAQGVGLTAPIGHVDTWTAWVNGSNSAVVNAVDFVGTDAYPYFQNTMPNSIENNADLFFEAYNNTVAAANGKPVWITETGYPVSGPVSGQAVASTQNAQTYWDGVACRVLGNINTFWYILYDAGSSPSFGVTGNPGSTTPLYDLSCSGKTGPAPSSSSKPSSTPVSVSQPSGSAPVSSAPVSSAPVSSAPAPSGGNPAPSGGETVTSKKTVYTTVCPTTNAAGQSTMMTSVVTSAPVSSVATPQPVGSQSPAPAPSASSGGKSCPTTLTSGSYEYPHLIVPVDKSNPDKSYGTQYNGTVSSTVSSLYNFDIPASDAGKTCSLVFLLPQQSQLQTSSFTLSGSGGLDVKGLDSPATEQSTYNSAKASKDYGGPSSVTPGNSYTIASGACPAGSRVGYELSATGSLALNYFQDYNPSPIGLYITVC